MGGRLSPWIKPVSIKIFNLLLFFYTDEEPNYNDVWSLKKFSRLFFWIGLVMKEVRRTSFCGIPLNP